MDKMLRMISVLVVVTVALADEVEDVPIVGNIIRHPEDGILNIPEDRSALRENEYQLKCVLSGDDSLVSDVQWFRLNEDWVEVDGESDGTLDVGSILESNKYSVEDFFRCQMGQDHRADFVVYIGNRSSVAKTQFRVKKFGKSLRVTEKEDLTVECQITSRRGDVDEIKKALEFKWYKWADTDDLSYVQYADDGTVVKENCSFMDLPDNKWLEITGDEIEAGSLEPHIQLLTNTTLKIEDARWEDRRGYKCLAFNKSDPLVCSQSTFFVRVKDKYAALWPFIGIVAEVVVLCLIIFFCERRKAAKGSGDDEEEYNGNAVGRTSENSNLRQRRT